MKLNLPREVLMKYLFYAILLTLSFSAVAKCPKFSLPELNDDQMNVYVLLKSAYQYQTNNVVSDELADFTVNLQTRFALASNYLDAKEVASFIIEQDLEDNICPQKRLVSYIEFQDLVDDRIVETYYGCGCEH